MPWKTGDVDKHVKGLSAHQKRTWVNVANSVLAACIKDGGDDASCAPKAIRQANAVAQRTPKEAAEALRLSDALGALLTEKGRVVSKKNESEIRSAIAALQAVLAQLAAAAPQEDAAEEAIEAARELLEAELSHDEIRQALRAAVGTNLMQGTYCWVRDVYDRFFVYQIEADSEVRYYRRSYVIADDGTVTLGDAVEVRPVTVYEPVGSGIGEAARQELATDLVPLVEKALRVDGSTTLKIIAPGWGSSGYYPAEVLERDGPGVFAKDLHLYWNHPTPTEQAERPERDLRDLAAVLETDARWVAEGPAGPGLYADAKVFGPYQEAVNELAPHIGVSILALGTHAPGEAEGRKGPIVKSLVAAKSVDFVTVPGAGGQVLELFEAARGGGPTRRPSPAEPTPIEEGHDVTDEEAKALREANTAAVGRIVQLEARLVEADARAVVGRELAAVHLPEAARSRLLAALVQAPPTKEGALDAEALAARVKEAVAAELTYIGQIGGAGAIRGMGAAPASETNAEQTNAQLERAFVGLGLSESAAKVAVGGRG